MTPLSDHSDFKHLAKEQVTILFLKYHNLVRLFAFEMAPVRDLTEDIVNDVYITFVKRAEHWDLSSDVVPLLRGITKKIAMRYWKDYIRNLPESLQKIAIRLQEETAKLAPPFGESDWDEETALLKKCLSRLMPEHYELILAHYFDGKSYKEISETGERTPGSIQRKVSRIRTALRKCVEASLQSRGQEVLHVE
ncbi:MAG: sigma-70 family RNA polymerase sigma factor [Planctomycetia bacterium]|nr:sigma-70 family RNA polymerase sigma factor [Planctomycetia bacterium]